MRKLSTALPVLILIAVILSACGGGGAPMNYGGSGGNSTASSAYHEAKEFALMDENTSSYNDYGEADAVYTIASDSGAGTVQSAANLSEKLIYTADVSIESVEFDDTVNSFLEMAKEYNAFFENTYVNGMINSDARTSQRRYANYTIRVPKAHFQEMLDRFYEIGNVLYASTRASNITAQYFDAESRLNTYRTEESRLLAMLEKANTVEDMIMVESRISEVRYQIESLTATLKNWQNQVDYSTIELSIREVTKLSESAPYQQTYSQELGSGIKSTLGAIGEFCKLLVKAVVVLSPVLIIAAVVVVIALRVRKRKIREKLERNKTD